jgi:hypothetical protein
MKQNMFLTSYYTLIKQTSKLEELLNVRRKMGIANARHRGHGIFPEQSPLALSCGGSRREWGVGRGIKVRQVLFSALLRIVGLLFLLFFLS